MFLILMYSLWLFLSLGGQFYLAYFSYVLSLTLAQMCLHGMSYRYLWPGLHKWNMISSIFFVGLTLASLSRFTSVSLETKERLPLIHKGLLFYAMLALLMSVASLTMYGNTVIRTTGYLTALLPLIVLPAGIAAYFKRIAYAKYFLTGTVFYIVGASLYGLKDSGTLSSSFLTEFGIMLGSLLEIGIYSLGIAVQLREMKRAKERAESDLVFNSAMSKIALQVSHDIRSPLTVLNAVIAKFKGENESLAMLHKATERINDIANSLLEHAKQDRPAILLQGNPLVSVSEVESIVGEVIREKEIEFGSRRLEFRPVSRDEVFLRIDVRELRQVTSNLINNAVEAINGSNDGKVTVGVRIYADQIALIFADNGKGIPAEVLPKLGQKGATFGKIGASGSGLGLYFAKLFAEAGGGNLSIQSKYGVGSVVTLTFLRVHAAPLKLVDANI